MKLMQSKTRLSLLLCLSLLLISLPAYSATGDSDTWEFHLAPYAWLAGQDGTVATLPGLPPVDIDIDFWDDVVGNINGALFLVGEARKGSYGVFMDLAYINIEIDNNTPGPYFSSVASKTESWMISAAGEYRLIEGQKANLDIFAGARLWSVESTLTLRAGIAPQFKVSNTEDWVDPIVGVKGFSALGDSAFFVTGGVAIGGFGAGSDFMWDAYLNLGYNWTSTFSTTVGYRYLDVDYEEDDFLYDVAQHGPMLGLSWRF